MAHSNEIFIVTKDRLEQSAALFATEKETFMSVMEEIKGHITTLETMWEGAAAEGFSEQFKKLHNNFTSYEHAISEYTRTLREASEKYDERETLIATATVELDNSKLFA